MAGVRVNFSEIVYSLKDLLLSARRHMNCSLVLSVAHTFLALHTKTHTDTHTQHTIFLPSIMEILPQILYAPV